MTPKFMAIYQGINLYCVEQLNMCLDDVKEWMSTNKLKLNQDKTEFIVFGSKRQRDKLKAYFPTTTLGSPLCLDESVKNLAVWFDSDFSFSKHVQNARKSCFVQLCDSRHVKWFLTHGASEFVANALVSSQWVIVTHFSRVSLRLIFVNYFESKIVQLNSYQIPVDILV